MLKNKISNRTGENTKTTADKIDDAISEKCYRRKDDWSSAKNNQAFGAKRNFKRTFKIWFFDP